MTVQQAGTASASRTDGTGAAPSLVKARITVAGWPLVRVDSPVTAMAVSGGTAAATPDGTARMRSRATPWAGTSAVIVPPDSVRRWCHRSLSR